ncbi:hypothetical protein AOL_s00173g369 [Orbilia oligospora ATCC 24927]|uniref:FAD/NAD(P)-binding domain-containing protein n=1 Tax=Arthrobotrys oligospora (strain ATCC 24927 / CBS 115.81 / DSM 1491) TaxID=756982 RepID=G1XPK1_ARTOA|nr:hypothetical protein AOL_s00173g369 [Orbilia oligospora ATCC 24927]EGX45268.1 hypothetical protein AOL_s00173g369 [Orbilia oligospora ATCC 24927]
MPVDTHSQPLQAVPPPTFKYKSPPSAASINASEVVSDYLARLQKAIEKPTVLDLQDVIFPEGFWRDGLFLTWDLRTSRGVDKISQFLSKDVTEKRLGSLKVKPTVGNYKRLPVLQVEESSISILAYIDVESDEGLGEGIIRLFLDSNNTWKAFTIYTTLTNLKSHPEASGINRPHGGLHGDQSSNPTNWKERLAEYSEFTTTDPTVLIIGGGQAGLTVAARLTRLGIPTLIVDKNPRIGDNWRNRYHSLVLHDPVWYDHLPYIPFPKTWPIFTPKDKLGDWLEFYARSLEIPVWTSTAPTSSSYENGKWTVKVLREGKERILSPKHVILATGHSGEPNIPTFRGQEVFKGKITHSSKWSNPERLKGKKVLVVGAGNTAHDIAQSLYSNGAYPTLIQRSSTHVLTSKVGLPALLGTTYCENGPEVEEADLQFFSLPNAVTKAYHQAIIKDLKSPSKDGKIIEGLNKAGFVTDDGPDGAGLLIKYFDVGGSYYIDIGASSMIIDGKIGVKHGRLDKFTEKGVLFEDGQELEAAEVVLATGYQNMRTTAGAIFPCVKDAVKPVGGFDSEGEFNTLFRDSGHPGFWFMGMNLAHCRWYSRVLALRIAGQEFGLY